MSAVDFFDVHSRGRIISAEARQKVREQRRAVRKAARHSTGSADSGGLGLGKKGPPEAVIKVVGWGKTARAAQYSVAYITRTRPQDSPGLALTAINQDGTQIAPDDLKAAVEGWNLKANADNLSAAARAADPATRAAMTEQERYKSRQTGHMILSMPPHSNASQEQVGKAAGDALREIFGPAGVEYLYVVHTDHSARPHAHVIFKATDINGHQIRIQPDDLRVMRQIFAEKATAAGVPLVATAREDRSELAAAIENGTTAARTAKSYYDIKKANSLSEIHWLAKQAPIFYERHGADYLQRSAGLSDPASIDPKLSEHDLAAATVLSEPPPVLTSPLPASDKKASPEKPADPLAPAALLGTLSAKSAVFDKAAIEREIAKHTRDEKRQEEIMAAVLKEPDLVQLTPHAENEKEPPAKFAMRAIVDLENRMLDIAEGLHSSTSHKVDDATLRAAIKKFEAEAGYKLTDEQLDAAEHLTGAGAIKLVEGLPGTGKSTMLTASRIAWESAGYEVKGAALAGIAADNLQQSGIKSSTIAALLLRIDEQNDVRPFMETGILTEAASTRFDRRLARDIEQTDDAETKKILETWRTELANGTLGKDGIDYARAWARDTLRFAPLSERSVLIVDEAGMIGSAQMTRLLEATESAKAKLVLVGDPEQIQPIEVGGAFRAVLKATEGVTLEDIRRQSEPWMRQATKDISRGRADPAIDAYDDAGAIHAGINANRTETITKLLAEHELNASDLRRIHKIIDYIEARRAAGAAFYLSQTKPHDPLVPRFFEFKDARDAAAATIAAEIEDFKPWLARFAINGEHLAADILVTENIKREEAIEKAVDHAEALGILDIEKSLTPEDRYELDLRTGAKGDLTAAWLSDYQQMPDASRIVLTHTNADAHDLNLRIRDGLKRLGVLTGDAVVTTTEEGDREFMAGDRLLFRRTHHFGTGPERVSVRNGTLGTVTSVAQDETSASLTVRLDSGSTFTFSSTDFDGFAQGYAVTSHKAQGVTVDRSFVLGSVGMNKHLLGVAMSRHRDSTQVFAATADAASAGQVAAIAGKAERAETTLDYQRNAVPRATPEMRFAETNGIDPNAVERQTELHIWADQRQSWIARQGERLAQTWQALRTQVKERSLDAARRDPLAPSPVELPPLHAKAQLELHKTFRGYADAAAARQRFLELYAEKAGLAVWAINNRPEVFGTLRPDTMQKPTFNPANAMIPKAWRSEAASALSAAEPRPSIAARVVAQSLKLAQQVTTENAKTRHTAFNRAVAKRAADRFGALPGATAPTPGIDDRPQSQAGFIDRILRRTSKNTDTPSSDGGKPQMPPRTPAPSGSKPEAPWTERVGPQAKQPSDRQQPRRRPSRNRKPDGPER